MVDCLSGPLFAFYLQEILTPLSPIHVPSRSTKETQVADRYTKTFLIKADPQKALIII